MDPTPDLAERRHIVATAVRLAEAAGSWDAVHVHAVAREAGIGLDDLARHFRDKDAIADGFFDEADAAMRSVAGTPGFAALDAQERIARAILAWLDALAPRRRLVAGMLRYKLHPEHLHLQVRGVLRVSDTVQWLREAALLNATGWRREMEEGVLTTIFLATFGAWLLDDSAGAQRSRRLLRRLLATAGRGALWLGFR